MGLHSQQTTEFIKLLTGHQPSVRAFIVSQMPGSPDVQDALQDVNVIIWEKMASYEHGTNFKAWAFSIARNVVREYRRKQQKADGLCLNEKAIAAINETWLARSEEAINPKQDALDLCLGTLNDTEKSLIEARYTKGTSLQKHSELIGRSAESLRVSLFRVRDKLRDCVSKRVAVLEMTGGLE